MIKIAIKVFGGIMNNFFIPLDYLLFGKRFISLPTREACALFEVEEVSHSFEHVGFDSQNVTSSSDDDIDHDHDNWLFVCEDAVLYKPFSLKIMDTSDITSTTH